MKSIKNKSIEEIKKIQKENLIDNFINILESDKEYSEEFKIGLTENMYAYSGFEYNNNNKELKEEFLAYENDSINKYIIDDEIVKYFALFYDIDMYYSDDDRKEYIELSHYPVLNDINVEIHLEDYQSEVENALTKFEHYITTKYLLDTESESVDVFQAGRSGKHILINFDNKLQLLSNLINIKEDYNIEENNFTHYINETYK